MQLKILSISICIKVINDIEYVDLNILNNSLNWINIIFPFPIPTFISAGAASTVEKQRQTGPPIQQIWSGKRILRYMNQIISPFKKSFSFK